MQLNVQELIEFASTLPPQFADMQLEHQRSAPQIVQPQLPAAPYSLAQDAQRVATVQPVVPQYKTERERMVQALAKEYRGRSQAEILASLGPKLGAEVADAVKSQAPTAQQAYAVCEREVREAYAKRGKALQALSNPPMQHSVQDYELVICTQLDQWALGNAPSVSEVLRIEFPDDPAKAKSIRGSTRVKRWKEAYNSDAVRNHPMEIAMRLTLDKSSINGRLMARNFGQSLSMNAALFKSSGRITKLNVLVEEQGTRISVLEQQMQETKTRESLADAGCSTSREKVLALSSQGKGPTEIARELGMNRDTVRKALQRARKAA